MAGTNGVALIILGPLADLSDVLRIARAEGKKVLNVHRVIVKPVIYPYQNDSYLVIVEPEIGGCSRVHDVVDGKKEYR
jgi:hypothetical protein